MPFRDKYTNFWFNDISSETMKVWLTNNKDIEFKATPNFTDTFVNPVSSQIRYHTGTTFSSNDFQLKCIAIGVNLLEWRAIENWLSPLAKGKLQFEFNDNTYYNVKVSKQIKGTSFVAGANHIPGNDTYNIEFIVEFTTTSDWAALGPQVIVPINSVYNDNKSVTMNLINIPSCLSTATTATFIASYTYNFMISDSSKWDTKKWWIDGLISKNTDSSLIIAGLNGNDSSAAITCLKESLAAYAVNNISGSINNKFGMPILHNRSMSMNTIYPSKSFTKIDVNTNTSKTTTVEIPTTSRLGRKYITEPTLLVNKTIYLDEEFWQEMTSQGESYSDHTYYLLDGGITHSKSLTTDIDYSILNLGQVGYIREQDLLSGTKRMILQSATGDNSYGVISNVEINRTGFTFYGMSVLFTGAKDSLAICPFYYLEDTNNYAVMNAGSYDSYPDLYLDLGLTVETQVKKEEELIYHYDVTVQNTTLGVDGKTGFVTFNNTLAEAATLVGDAGQTRVVERSTNNGVLNIPSGNPELLRVRVFGVTHPTISTDQRKIEDVQISQIFLQPVGEFKYPRNGKYAAMLFSSLKREAVYNEGFYPLTNESFVNANIYGSKVEDYVFSTNALLNYGSISANANGWVLTLPTKDLVGSSLYSADQKKGTLTTPQYMYLSLCDYTEVTITTDTSMESYIMMQTRDAF